MKSTLKRLIGALSVGLTLVAAAPAQAGPFSGLYVFGDSLSDTGNILLATGGALPVSPYLTGRFSDGPVWIDRLAQGLGLPDGAKPSLAGGNNYAFGGARTGAEPPPPGGLAIPGVLAQVAGLWSPAYASADPNALYVVVGGGNDMRDARGPASTAESRQAAAAAAAANLFNSVALLASKGARHVLLSNLPDLGATPEAAALGLVAQSTDATNRFNALVAALEVQLESLFSIQVDVLDMAGVGAAIRQDALTNGGAAYGITNVFTPCGTFTGSIGISCDVSLFSDALHPSARAHAILAEAALRLLPTPGTAGIAALGLALLLVTRRRRA